MDFERISVPSAPMLPNFSAVQERSDDGAKMVSLGRQDYDKSANNERDI